MLLQVECAKAGALEKVNVFEGSEHGAVAVRFKSVDDAERCVAMLDERQFGAGTVRCAIYDGVTDYRARHVRLGGGKGGGGGAAMATEEGARADGGAAAVEDQERSIDAFGDWLEASSTDEDA